MCDKNLFNTSSEIKTRCYGAQPAINVFTAVYKRLLSDVLLDFGQFYFHAVDNLGLIIK